MTLICMPQNPNFYASKHKFHLANFSPNSNPNLSTQNPNIYAPKFKLGLMLQI